MVSTGFGQFAVNGRRLSWAGGRKASCSSRTNAASGTRVLSAGMGSSTLGHVKNALGSTAIVDGVVEHTVVEAITRHQLVVPRVGVYRQRQLTRVPVVIENECFTGKARGLGKGGRRQQPVDIVLDSPVSGAQMLGEQPGLLAIPGKEVAG